MKTSRFVNLILVLPFFACINDCPPGINLLPMFGNAKKCPEQLKADENFIVAMTKEFRGDRKKAAQDRVARAWYYYNKNVSDTAIFRFNQAWLLDSLNAEVYWGFGNILGNQSKFKESILFLKKSIRLNSDNPLVWASLGQSYGNLYNKSNNGSELDSCIYFFKNSFKLNPSNGSTTSKLAIAYLEAMEADSARKYQALTDKINPSIMPKEIREAIDEMD